jgi:hypothetical protein
MNFFANKKHHFVFAIAMIAIEPLYPNVMVGRNNAIKPSFSRNIDEFIVGSAAVRVGGMYV